jgi:hypothetical protein
VVGSTALEKYHRKFAFDSDPNGYFFEEVAVTWLEISAACYVCIVLLVIVWQVCLIGGAPWGHLTQGGGHIGALPPNGRVVAAFSIPILALMAAGIASAASLYPHWAPWTGLVAVTVQTVVTTLNWMTPSKPERLLWAPITSIMLLLASYVVLSAY